MRQIMENDKINMKSMLTSSQQSVGSFNIPKLEEKKNMFKNSRRSVGAIIEPYFEGQNTFSKAQLIDLSNTLLNKPYANQIGKILPTKSSNQMMYDSLLKQIAKLKK